ncbi:hypothetical protein RJ639_023314 [Escallonia herrerae]|uniref:Uncharacterized protein n=1 Tax=Escallonia herrerae TaxID=1293975 RepID=A0AA88V1F0_9ASTE|nr:hypothetical protein RJ639_023050 [Escallonia herrerae]KAK2999893.1 hypothetical protein RJ639_023314 [Escallonia herrerae]
MTRQIVLPQPAVNRRQPLLTGQNSSSRGSVRFAEVAGGTTAECAAVCCCCPCGIVNLLVLAVYKLPAGLCRRALRRKRRRRLMKKGLLQQGGSSHQSRCGCDDTEMQIHPVSMPAADKLLKSPESDKDVMELEKEMWERFYGTGFWRSPSQRA